MSSDALTIAGDGAALAPLQTINFSDNAVSFSALMQVSSLARRLWLVDSASLGFDAQKDLKSPEFKQLFREVTNTVGNWVATTPADERFHDEIWKARTDLVLLDPPFEAEPNTQSSLFSPFRLAVYEIYNHIFYDVYNAMQRRSGEGWLAVGAFNPPMVSVIMVTVSADESGRVPVQHRFDTDTFVYPIWIEPGTTLTLAAGEHQASLVSEGSTWTSALWFEGNKPVTITPHTSDGKRSAIVAVLALGPCDPRPLPAVVPEETPPVWNGRPWAKEGEPIDETAPEAWPETDHLARAIFLKAGDAVERCSFDDSYVRVEEEEEPANARHNAARHDASKEYPLYSALPGNNTIRILAIEPGSGEELRTRLDVAALDEKPTYEAISYTWGDPSDKTLLRCGTGNVLIPRNLDIFLKRLRNPTRTRYVWADSVCINQDDIRERGQQVSIMRNIYDGSERVLVWLGLDTDNKASTAFKAVCDVVRFWGPKTDRLRFSSYANRLEPMGPGELAQARETIQESAWEALRTMFEADYFRRFWIIQELALGSSAVVFWGDHHISWGLIGICAAWTLTNGWYFNFGSPITAAYNAFLIYALPLAKPSGISPFSKLDLSIILGTTAGRFNSTDARDRIFALLGMPFVGNEPGVNPLITPDYSQSLRSVSIEAARRIIEQDGNLRILGAIQHGPELDLSYPSWVPQWDKAHSAEPLGLRNEQGFYANGGEIYIPSPSDDLEALHLTGLIVGTIASVSETLQKGALHFQAISDPSHCSTMQKVLSGLNSPETQLCASWGGMEERAVLFGFNDPEQQAKTLSPESKSMSVSVTIQPGSYAMRNTVETLGGERAKNNHLGEYLLYWRERVSWNAKDLKHRQMGPFWGLMESMKESDPYAMERALCSMNTLAGRCFFECEDGMDGLGPAATREGDVLAVLFGAVVPFVLRPVDRTDGSKCWSVVGECLVPGLMQGEAVERAGLLKAGSYTRGAENGRLQHEPLKDGEVDPRLHRKVGENGVCAFEIR
ncbi:heterokaryon incompatibility protein-domain-containing protein [Lasiosphaeris hirsuta]|uniref:Heterokaryon incompatibility protein-domain-containing protein n=1 Tax=Lasiosphaeris hirsuta TaxID=260670 RepID=A0AA40AZM0_9PEZI|nr:heterokaryon incompatibility protein-domain-containing protein [Lasiosphaeris hirsuta]